MKNKYFVISVFVSFILAVLPFAIIFLVNGNKSPKLPVEIVDDSNYYYARATNLSYGNILIGNPYIKENKDEMPPAFFVGDWLWAFPLVIGFSIQNSIIISQIFWFLIFGVFLYWIFHLFDLKQKYIIWSVVFVFLFVYWYLARPVAMQVVYPVFLIWVTSFILFLKEPKQKRNILFLIFSTTLSVYVYTYLTQIIFVSMVIILGVTFFENFKKYKSIWSVSIASFCFSIPFILFTWKQIHWPFYFDTLNRIGLVNTHMIGVSAIVYLSIVILGAFLFFLNKKYFSDADLLFFWTISLGLFIATISNVVTGKDLELAVHIGRFVELWSVMCLFIIFGKIDFRYRISWPNFIFLCFAIINFSFVGFQVRVWKSIDKSILKREVYASSLNWLKSNTKNDSVVLADDSFSSYVPIMTQDYVLFHPNALLQIDSDENIKDRYLASRIFQDIKIEDIKGDMRKYAGAGYTAHRHMVNNRYVKLCNFTHLDLFGVSCGKIENQYSLMGEKYFTDMQLKYNLLKKDYLNTLKKYNVSYVVLDKENDKWTIPKTFRSVWTDGRFEIYSVN